MALIYTLVSGIGFVTDAALLKLGVQLGLEAAVARAISLFVAMQVTFVLNGCVVFRCLDLKCAPARWVAYMATNAVGNLANYFVFVTLLSLHRPLLSDRMVALVLGSLCAWTINYAAARLVVFQRGRQGGGPAGGGVVRPVGGR